MSVLFPIYPRDWPWGCLTTLFWVSGKDLGRGYFITIALIVLGLLGIDLVIAVLHPVEPFGAEAAERHMIVLAAALAAAFVYYGAIWKERWRLALWPLGVAMVLTGYLLLRSAGELIPVLATLPHRETLVAANLIASGLLLGWSLTTMLLGHWYLVVPNLTFRHLIVFCWVLLGVVILRCGIDLWTLVVAYRVDPFTEPHPWRLLVDLNGGQGMFFWFRTLWGLAIPLLLALMSLHCARTRSNQSATGILYVLVVGSLIGEITALYITVTTGVPI